VGWTSSDAQRGRLDLYPADSSGDLFVAARTMTILATLSFGALTNQRPQVYSGGRITLRSE
jgi:hypothetical protein